jgi:hypothetical protein
MAAVTVSVSCLDEPTGEQTITCTNDGGELIRAIALDISLNNGALITSVTEVSSEYTIYPGSIVIDPCELGDPSDGVIVAPGSAVCDGSAYAGTLGGIGTGGMTIEMASLDSSPGQTDALICSFTVDKQCTVTVSANTIRGGIVMEDPDVAPGDNLPVEESACLDANCPCYGDLVNETPPGHATPVGIDDIFELIGMLTGDVTGTPYSVSPGDPGYNDCGDLIFTGVAGVVDIDDIFEFVPLLMPMGASVGCQPAP